LANAAGKVSLGIEINEQDPLPDERKGGGQIDRGRRFSDASFLVCNRNNLRHFWYLTYLTCSPGLDGSGYFSGWDQSSLFHVEQFHLLNEKQCRTDRVA
jgi:hypothetical protein